MTTIVTQPTPTALWHALVLDAEHACHQSLDHDMESYLVFLLMRFTQDQAFAGRIMAMEFMQGMQATGKVKQLKLRDVADSCLITSGLFPQQAARRQVSVRYYMDLGRSAYLQLALAGGEALATLYEQLASKFAALMDVLHALREFGGQKTLETPLDLHDTWQAGSQRSLQRLSTLMHADSLPLPEQSKSLH